MFQRSRQFGGFQASAMIQPPKDERREDKLRDFGDLALG